MILWPGRQAATPTLPGAEKKNETGEPEVWERLFVFFGGKDSLPHNPNLIGNNS